LLNTIGLRYCGDDELGRIAQRQRGDLSAYCAEPWNQSPVDYQLSPGNSPEDVEKDWKTWERLETRRRVGYSIWLLDCMWAFHTDCRPLLSLRDATVPLPCQEILWEAESAVVWRQLFELAISEINLTARVKFTDLVKIASPSLLAAIQSLYIEKRLNWTLGECSRILLVHALFQRTWEVENYLSQPLSQWTPTAKKQEVPSRQEEPWLPGIPLYTKWRNSACDSLDVLHWAANAVIGVNSGMEHPTVLHLHVSRIILLTPFRSIRRLASSMAGLGPSMNEEQIKQDKLQVERWAEYDQYKARLAIVHAGILFWHVRHYSTNGFYESHALLLATLALWAYGTFSPSQSNIGAEDELEVDFDSLCPSSINLDRPADDEIVQLFVRRGSQMKALITGVGDLCSSRGPEKVLNIGSKLISRLPNWGCARRHFALVKKLAALIKQS